MSHIEQWYPTNEMLPLNRREGAENNWVLGAWVKDGKLVSMRTVMCDGDGVFWLTPEVKAKSTPQFFRELPEGPMDKTEVDRLRTDLAAARAEAEEDKAQIRDLISVVRRAGVAVDGAAACRQTLIDAEEWRIMFRKSSERLAASESRCAALAKECAELRKDRERLDWLESKVGKGVDLRSPEGVVELTLWHHRYITSYDFNGATVRAAIDAARADAARKEQT